jgi:hypothetical protein
LSSGNKRGKNITARMQDVQGIDVYKRVTIQDAGGSNDYYVSRISKFDYMNKEIDMELIQL